MYCHTSSSVQLLIGNTRTCSPLCTRALYRFQSSGRWFFGSHWPNSSRKREHALLGARLLLVAARAADAGVEAELGDRVEQRHRLVRVAAFVRRRAARTRPLRDRVLDRAHDQPLAQLGRARVAKRDHFGEVVAGVDVQQREREAPGAERLLREAQQHERILAAREEQGGVARTGPRLRAGCGSPRTRASRGGAASAGAATRRRRARRCGSARTAGSCRQLASCGAA